MANTYIILIFINLGFCLVDFYSLKELIEIRSKKSAKKNVNQKSRLEKAENKHKVLINKRFSFWKMKKKSRGNLDSKNE